MRNNKHPHNSRKTGRPFKRLSTGRPGQLSAKQQQVRVKGLAAINRVRRGQSKSLSAAAKAEGTTVKAIKKLLPAALIQNRPGQTIRVKSGDPYSAKVQILTKSGPISVVARGSRQRELAGRHRAIVNRVLAGNESPAALMEFRGKAVGGRELITDFDLLSQLVQADAIDQLSSLYVSPEASQ